MSERTHFVYTAWDSADRPLYVGCTAKPEARKRQHRHGSAWYPYAVRFTLAGPYSEATALLLERERIVAIEPHFNWLPRHQADTAKRAKLYRELIFRYRRDDTLQARLDRECGMHSSADGRHRAYRNLLSAERVAA